MRSRTLLVAADEPEKVELSPVIVEDTARPISVGSARRGTRFR